MIFKLLKYIEEDWQQLGLDIKKPKKLLFVVRYGTNKPVCFIYDTKANPIFVAKIFDNNDDNMRLRFHRESKALLNLQKLIPLNNNIFYPQPFKIFELDYCSIILEEYITGIPMEVYDLEKTNIEKINEQMGLVYNWLIDFNSKVKIGFINFIPEEIVQKYLGKYLAYLKEKGSPQSHICNIKNHYINICAEAKIQHIPLVITHIDLRQENILTSKESIVRVIDWEHSSLGETPFFGWFIFLFRYYRYIYTKHYRNQAEEYINRFTIEKLFFDDDEFTSISDEWTKKFFAKYNIDTQLIPLFLFGFLSRFKEIENNFNKILEMIEKNNSNRRQLYTL